jgi:hypothetical protein
MSSARGASGRRAGFRRIVSAICLAASQRVCQHRRLELTLPPTLKPGEMWALRGKCQRCHKEIVIETRFRRDGE